MSLKVFFSIFLFLATGFLNLYNYDDANANRGRNEFMTIGTGGVTGIYFPAGGAICRFINRQRNVKNVKCSVESTGGSIYNLNTIASGEKNYFGIVQSDWEYHNYRGTSKVFADHGKNPALRSIFTLHSEPFTVVAREDSGVKDLNDLVGKRVNIGSPGSGTRAVVNLIMNLKGWKTSDFKVASQLKAPEQAQALCDNKIDVMTYNVGHPNGAIQEVANSCNVKLVDVIDNEINQLIELYPFYVKTTIPGGLYEGNPTDVQSVGVKASLVTSSDTSEALVYHVTKTVIQNLSDFKTLHPVFNTLTLRNMIGDAKYSPLHDGAKKYYLEEGYLNEDGTATDKLEESEY